MPSAISIRHMENKKGKQNQAENKINLAASVFLLHGKLLTCSSNTAAGKDRHLQAGQCSAVLEGAALMPKNQQIYRAFPSFSTKSELPRQRSRKENVLAVLSKREREGKGEEERQRERQRDREREETKKRNPQWELCYSGLSHL